MMRSRLGLWRALPLLALSLFLLASAPLWAAKDAVGDDLPAGALQRLGSLRLKYGGINDAQYLPDGRVLVLIGSTLDVLDMSTGLRQEQRKLPISAASLQVGSDGHTLLLAGGNATVCLYDFATGKELRSWPTGQVGLKFAQFSPDGTRVLTVGRMPPTLKEWDLATGKELVSLQGKQEYYDKAVYALGGKVAVAGGGYNLIDFWSLETGQLLKAVGTDYCIYDMVASADGTRVLAGQRSYGSEWDVATATQLKRYTGHHGGAVTGQCYGANPDEVITGSRDGSVRRWNRQEAKVLLRWFPHAAYAGKLRVSPDGKWVLSYTSGQYLTETDLQTGQPRLALERHSASVGTVAWTPDGKVISGSLDATSRLWDPTSGKCLAVMPAGIGASCVAASPDGKRLAIGGKDSVIRECDAAGKPLREIKGHRGYVRAVLYLPDGRLASCADDGSIRLWGEGPDPVATLEGHRGGVLALILADGKHLASAGRDGSVRVWEIASGKQLWSKVEHRGYVTCLAAGAQGSFYSSGRDGRILRWNVASGLQPGEMAGAAWTDALAVTPGGSGLWAGSSATSILAFDAAGKALPALAGHVGGINALAVSPDGKRLVSASADGTLLVWPTAPPAQ